MREELIKIWNHTLKRSNGIYSRTSLTWLVSFVIANIMALTDLCMNGFNLAVFSIYIGYVFGTKWLETQNKKDTPSDVS